MYELRRDRMSEPDTPEPETRHTISESADKIVLKTNVKRGTGTRDQDKIDVKVKGDDPEETVDRLNDVLANLAESGTADTVRELRADPDGEEDSE